MLSTTHLFLRSALNSSGWATALLLADSAEVLKHPRQAFDAECSSHIVYVGDDSSVHRKFLLDEENPCSLFS